MNMMKKVLFTIMLAASCFLPVAAQTTSMDTLTQEFRDKMELKELVDVFSVLADRKDAKAQEALFTEDATVNSYRDGKLVSTLQGRKQIGEGFGNFLKLFDTVYHINGQQVVTVNGDKATGVSYCQVILIGKDDKGQRTMTTQGVTYDDEYQRVDGKWMIGKRTSHFVWSDRKVIEQ